MVSSSSAADASQLRAFSSDGNTQGNHPFRRVAQSRLLRPFSGRKRSAGQTPGKGNSRERPQTKPSADDDARPPSELWAHHAMGAVGEALLRQLKAAGLADRDDFVQPKYASEPRDISPARLPTPTVDERVVQTRVEDDEKPLVGERRSNALTIFSECSTHTPQSTTRFFRSPMRFFRSGGSSQRSKISRSLSKLTVVDRPYSALRHCCERAVTSAWFDGVIAVIVLINSVTMALDSEFKAGRGDDVIRRYHKINMYRELFFNSVYTIEAFMRWVVSGRQYFNNWVNNLDLLVVATGWLTSIGELFEDSGLMEAVGALKVLRALRALRFCRMIAFFNGIWIVFQSFTKCMRPLLWTCLFVFVIIFIFAMFAVELIGTSKLFDTVPLQEEYKSSLRAFLSLFQVMTLDEWRAITQPLMDHQWWTYLFFALYVCISSLALVNLITAVIVENALKTMQADEEGTVIEQSKTQEEEKKQISKLFRMFDSGRDSGSRAWHHHDKSVTAFDFIRLQEGSWKTLSSMFETLGISDEQDMAHLLELLASDNSGSIQLSALLEGMLDLRPVMEDRDRTALLHVSPSRTHKFNIIKRSLDQRHSADNVQDMLRRVELFLSDLGVAPVPEFAEKVRAQIRERERSRRKMEERNKRTGIHMGSMIRQKERKACWEAPVDDVSTPSTAATATPLSKRSGSQSPSRLHASQNQVSAFGKFGESDEGFFNQPKGDYENEVLSVEDHQRLLEKLRGLRFCVQKQSHDLRHQREQLEALQKEVDLLKTSRAQYRVHKARRKRDPVASGVAAASNAYAVHHDAKGDQRFVVKEHLMAMLLNGRER